MCQKLVFFLTGKLFCALVSEDPTQLVKATIEGEHFISITSLTQAYILFSHSVLLFNLWGQWGKMGQNPINLHIFFDKIPPTPQIE